MNPWATVGQWRKQPKLRWVGGGPCDVALQREYIVRCPEREAVLLQKKLPGLGGDASPNDRPARRRSTGGARNCSVDVGICRRRCSEASRTLRGHVDVSPRGAPHEDEVHAKSDAVGPGRPGRSRPSRRRPWALCRGGRGGRRWAAGIGRPTLERPSRINPVSETDLPFRERGHRSPIGSVGQKSEPVLQNLCDASPQRVQVKVDTNARSATH